MTRSRLYRWARRLATLVAVIVAVLCVAWFILIWVTEDTPRLESAALVGTVSVADAQYSGAIENARAHIRMMMKETQSPGLAVAVALDGSLVWLEGFGFADLNDRIPVDGKTQFRVCSVSKLFTAAAMARLYEAGLLDLDAPIQRYVPDFPDKGHPITARHLASHRSGIRGYRDDQEAYDTKYYSSVTMSLEWFRNDPLMFPPDSDFGYSGYGYVLLSAVLEGASGQEFLTLVRRQVFEPLKMTSTIENRAQTRAPFQSSFYDNVSPFSTDGRIVSSPYTDPSFKWAAGGFLSTPEDLVRFGTAHMASLNSGFLKRETLDVLFTSRTRPLPIMGYGLGWMTARDPHGREADFHFGACSGGTSVLVIYPEHRVSIAILSNLGHAKFPYGRLMRIANAFLPDPAGYLSGAYLGLFNIGAVFVFVRHRKRRKRDAA